MFAPDIVVDNNNMSCASKTLAFQSQVKSVNPHQKDRHPVATSETARVINRRVLLNLIRKHQPVSRADLARHSGLQRSTVSAITQDLIADSWVKEGEVHNLPRGRKPTVLHLNSARSGVFAINLRPYSINLALVGLDGDVVIQETLPAPGSMPAFLEQVTRWIQRVASNHPAMLFEGIGVSLPGRIDLFSQRFVFAPNLAWKHADLKQQLEAATGMNVHLENEANACALSELFYGGHKSRAGNLVALAVSEGIGVGMVLNGQLVRGPSGLAGEFGHVTLREQGLPCACGNKGCWEMYASNTAALRYYYARKSSSHSKIRPGTSLPGPGEFEKLLHLAETGDPDATAALEEMSRQLGAGIAMLVTGLAPEVIVVVGEITRAWDRVEPLILDAIRERSFTHAQARLIARGPAHLPRLLGVSALVMKQRFDLPFAGFQ